MFIPRCYSQAELDWDSSLGLVAKKHDYANMLALGCPGLTSCEP